MNMNTLLIILMFAAGLALGAFYFISLWQTLQKLGQTENRMLLLAISYVLRLAVVLTAFYLMMQGGHWERLVAAMIGFVAMRKILTYRFGPQKSLEVVHE